MERQQSSMVRVAVWLAVDVQEGGVFTKQQLREAVPNVEQADRRMRDLRSFGWRIDTNGEDASLRPEELRLVTVGDRVWEATFRPRPSNKPTSAQQRAALIAAAYSCESCGVGVGQTFAESPNDVAMLTVRFADPARRSRIEVVCQRCRLPSGEVTLEQERALARLVSELSDAERTALIGWTTGSKALSSYEHATSLLRRWPSDGLSRAVAILNSEPLG